MIKLLQTETDSKCRLCKQFYEKVKYVISACLILAKEQYIQRRDRVCAQLHFNICKEIGVKLTTNTGMTMYSKSVATSREVNTLRTGLLNCLNARSRGLTFRHRASCI